MSLNRELISRGFTDLDKSSRFLAAAELRDISEDRLFAGLAHAANPDLALQSLVRLLAVHPALGELVRGEAADSEALFQSQ